MRNDGATQPRRPSKATTKRKAQTRPTTTNQKRKYTRNHRIEERDEDGKTAQDRENESITAALRKADVISLFANSDAVKAHLASELGQIVDENRAHTDLMKNAAREQAQTRLQSIVSATTPGVVSFKTVDE